MQNRRLRAGEEVHELTVLDSTLVQKNSVQIKNRLEYVKLLDLKKCWRHAEGWLQAALPSLLGWKSGLCNSYSSFDDGFDGLAIDIQSLLVIWPSYANLHGTDASGTSHCPKRNCICDHLCANAVDGLVRGDAIPPVDQPFADIHDCIRSTLIAGLRVEVYKSIELKVSMSWRTQMNSGQW